MEHQTQIRGSPDHLVDRGHTGDQRLRDIVISIGVPGGVRGMRLRGMRLRGMRLRGMRLKLGWGGEWGVGMGWGVVSETTNRLVHRKIALATPHTIIQQRLDRRVPQRHAYEVERVLEELLEDVREG
jgi:hypothetical protein